MWCGAVLSWCKAYLADVGVTEGEDGRALLLDLLSHGVLVQGLHNLVQGRLGHLLGDDVGHPGADLLHVRGLAVAVLPHLCVRVGGFVGRCVEMWQGSESSNKRKRRKKTYLGLQLAGEGDGEHTQGVSVRGLDLTGGLDESAPLLEEGAELVGGEGHSVEVHDHVAALDVLSLHLDLAALVVLLLRLHEVGKVQLCGVGVLFCFIFITILLFISFPFHIMHPTTYLEHTSLDRVRAVEGTLGPVDQGLAAVAHLVHRGGDHVVPLLVGEGVSDLTLGGTLATLGETLVLADGHFVSKVYKRWLRGIGVGGVVV